MSRYVNMIAPKQTWRTKFEARGRALIESLLTNPTVFYDDCVLAGRWLFSPAGGGTVALDKASDSDGGLFNMTAPAGGTANVYLNNQSGTNRTSQLRRPSTVPWYHAARFLIDTAPDAGTVMSFGLGDAGVAQDILFGVQGAKSLAVFTATSGANEALSAVALGTGVFELEMWGVGSTTLKFRVNGEDPKSLTYGNGAVDAWSAKLTTTQTGGTSKTWRMADYLSITNGT
jgi:hypothetical protein